MTIPTCCFLCQASTPRQCEHCQIPVCSDNHYRSHRLDNQCLPFRVGTSLTAGRHFVATRNIGIGETILVDEASVVGPATKTNPLCLECFKLIPNKASDKTLCKCGFYFCSSCFNKKGGLHELECNQIKTSVQPNEDQQLQFACIFLLRFWMLRLDEPEKWDRLNFLSSGEIKDLETADFVDSMVRIMQTNFGANDVKREDVHRMMGIKRTNASNLSSIGLEGATALYPTYTLMNSYCFCNSRSTIDPKTFTMRVKAHKNIKSGEEISTRYVTVFEGQPRRRKMIWKGWKFICQCQRCMDPTEFGTYFSAVKCQGCSSGYVLPEKTDILAPPWQCNNCNKTYGNNEIEKIVDELEVRIHAYYSREGSSHSPHNFISKVLESQVHPSHFLVIQVKNLFFNLDARNISKKSFDTMSQNETNEQQSRLEEQIRYGQEILNLNEILDPGYGSHKALLLKKLASLKMKYAKLKYCINNDQEEYNDHMGSSLEMIKDIALCL